MLFEGIRKFIEFSRPVETRFLGRKNKVFAGPKNHRFLTAFEDEE